MKKCDFYTNVNGKPELVSGYAVRILDGSIYWLYFIYKNASSGTWYIIDPNSGFALAHFRKRATAAEGVRHYHAKAVESGVYETAEYEELCRDFEQNIAGFGLGDLQPRYSEVYAS